MTGDALVVVGHENAGLHSLDGAVGAHDADVTDLNGALSANDHSFHALHPDTDHPKLSRHFRVEAPAEKLEELASTFAAHPAVAGAWVQPAGSPPILDPASYLHDPNDPELGPAPERTPDYEPRQGYLDDAPVGVGARTAWNLPGGRGAGVTIIDCEAGWNLSHEDLQNHELGVLGDGKPRTDPTNLWVQHGTSVLGVMDGDVNDIGVVGISAEADVGAVVLGSPAGPAIRWAADYLSPGDILLIELELPLIQGGFYCLTAVEWWPTDFDAIRYAVDKGIIVVEPAANGGPNGGLDLGSSDFDTPQKGFPSDWENPFKVGGPDSGAILVGAGDCPSGTHGRTEHVAHHSETYVDRARCGYSNYGARLDVQGWGWEVTTSGGGKLPPKHKDPNRWYTDTFHGTSSASPIVAGALACVQGVLRAKGMNLMTPSDARELLRRTGSPQMPAEGRPVSQRIGNRPDIHEMLVELGAL